MHRIIIPNNYKYIGAEAKNMSLKLSLNNDKQLVRESAYNEIINQYDRYLDEREACNTIRLTATVNLIADNVLFNRITEVVKNEGSSECECLNFNSVKVSSTTGKSNKTEWGKNTGILGLIRDTQLSYSGDDEKNYTYNCGIDIFNNHILRSKTWYQSLPSAEDSNFNTIFGNIVDSTGRKITSIVNYSRRMHVYNSNNILSFESCVENKLQSKNGWLGFINSSSMMLANNLGKEYGISRVINNIPCGQFVEMFPGSDRLSLMPHYNKYRHRKEKNWEYCLTYPYSSTTQGINCINEELGTLKIAFIDESTEDADGLQKTTIFSVSKHGLAEGDTINLYKSTIDNKNHEIVGYDVNVDKVIDDYTFDIYMSEPVCTKWLSILESEEIYETFGNQYNYANNYVKYGNRRVYAYNGYINADLDDNDIGAQNLSFCKTEDDTECKYYVRIFSRFPNFDFLGSDVNEEIIYSTDSNGVLNVEKYAKESYDKSSTLTKMAFAKNAYGDDIVQIVYNDDIDINYLHDNLGRPLTNLYLSFFKTNYGHREWYNENLESSNIEHSRCWGPLTCGFKYNPVLEDIQYKPQNINFMCNTIEGLDQLLFRDVIEGYETDEISYKRQSMFYGDLCCYSPSQCRETVIQDIMHRFNSQQRELATTDLSARTDMNVPVKKDVILYDDTDNVGFHSNTQVFDNNPLNCPEGYYYKAHYQIPVRIVSGDLNEYEPDMIKLSELAMGNDVFTGKTAEANYFDKSDRLFIYSISDATCSEISIINVLSTTMFTFTIDNVEKISGGIDGTNIDRTNYRIYAPLASVPSYAKVAEDGSGVVRWRTIYQNGFEDTDDAITRYPFTNNRLYVNKDINIFLRRQDPYGDFGLCDNISATYLEGKSSPYRKSSTGESTDNSYSSEEDSSC